MREGRGGRTFALIQYIECTERFNNEHELQGCICVRGGADDEVDHAVDILKEGRRNKNDVWYVVCSRKCGTRKY